MEPRSTIPSFEVSKSSPEDWDNWIELLNFYFVSEKIMDPGVKQAKLMLYGGPEIRKLYFSLPKVTEFPAGQDAYSYTVECLTAKIHPKSSKRYERAIFNSLCQQENENFRSFLTRLRQQAKVSQFPIDFESEAIADRVVAGCRSVDLRKELLRKDYSLEETERLGLNYETTDRQASSLGAASLSNSTSTPAVSTVNKLQASRNKFKKKKHSESSKNSSELVSDSYKCFGCGRKGHRPRSSDCPAKDVTCRSCGKIGHYQLHCKSSSPVSTDKNKFTNSNDKSTVKAVKDEQVFNVRESNNPVSDEIVTCTLGGVEQIMFIDSGSLFTMMSEETWNLLRQKGLRYVKYERKPETTFYDGSLSYQYHEQLLLKLFVILKKSSPLF